MVQQVAVAWTDVGVGEVLVNLQRFRFYPFPIFPIESFLGNLTDVNLRVEVGGECLVVVACVAVDDIEILNLLEVVLGSIGRIDAGYSWVEAASEDGSQSGLLELLTISPLPRVFKVSLVLGFVVGSVQIRASTCQTGLHDGQVLVGQCEVDDQFGLIVAKQSLQLLHIVSIHLCRLDVQLVASLLDVLYYLVAFRFTTRCNHELSKHVSILCYLECCYCCDATGANH